MCPGTQQQHASSGSVVVKFSSALSRLDSARPFFGVWVNLQRVCVRFILALGLGAASQRNVFVQCLQTQQRHEDRCVVVVVVVRLRWPFFGATGTEVYFLFHTAVNQNTGAGLRSMCEGLAALNLVGQGVELALGLGCLV